jgi:hypothetical protein
MAYAYGGTGMGLMTLENVAGTDYLRPLTASEYHFSGQPLANANWVVDRYISPDGGPFAYADRRNFGERNITGDTVVNSITLGWNAGLSGQAVPTAERDYLIIDPAAVLTISSGIINFASFTEATTANLTASIRGGRLDMNGQAAIINSAMAWHDTDATSGTWSSIIAGNSSYMRSSMTNVTDLVKTGRNSLYLDTWNDLTGNVYVSEQGGFSTGTRARWAPGRRGARSWSAVPATFTWSTAPTSAASTCASATPWMRAAPCSRRLVPRTAPGVATSSSTAPTPPAPRSSSTTSSPRATTARSAFTATSTPSTTIASATMTPGAIPKS